MNFGIFGPYEGFLTLIYLLVLLGLVVWLVRSVNRIVSAQERVAHCLQEIVRSMTQRTS